MAVKNLILAGDIGGTKTNIAVFSAHGEKLKSESSRTFPSKQYSGLTPILKEFLGGQKCAIEAACFGIAGPIVDGRVKTTNLPWIVDSGELRRVLKVDSVALLNDLEAGAYGISTLEEEEFYTLNEGRLVGAGNKAVIAAGTGLGQAILYDDGRCFRPLATEAGHADFAPRDEMEIALLRHLIGRFGHVSNERILSGPGLFNIYRFLKEDQGMPEPAALSERLATAEDASAVISNSALALEFEITVKALDLFVAVYGAEAGNLVLRAKAVRGLYVGGGIAPKIIDKLKDGTFTRAFTDKGRYADLLAAVPVQVILNQQAALRGAAYYAAFLSGD